MNNTTKLTLLALLSALSCSVASAELTTTTFNGLGAVNVASNYDSGAPSNANPGLINSTGNSWLPPVLTDFAALQTGGRVYRDSGVAFRGGAEGSGNKTIWEIDDVRTDYDSYTSLHVGGVLSFWSEHGQGHEINIESGVVNVDAFYSASTYDKSSVSIKNGIFHADAGVAGRSANLTFNFLNGGSGEVVIDDAMGMEFSGVRLNFETGTRATFMIGAVNEADSTSKIKWLIDNRRVLIDGIANTDFTNYVITESGTATMLSIIPAPKGGTGKKVTIPEPSSAALLLGVVSFAWLTLRRR